MRTWFTCILLLWVLYTKAQDKIYLVNGECKQVKITEIRFDSILFKTGKLTEGLALYDVLLLEFANGKTELISPPGQNVIYRPQGYSPSPKSKTENGHLHQSQLSINTLALVNSDVSIFYEYIFPNKKVGLGVMGAYNFNVYVNLPNLYLLNLNNAKKLYDLGAFVNFYPGKLDEQSNLYMGLFVKYMPFNFSSIYTDPVNASVTYKPARGYELATMFNFGVHQNITKNFFIKSNVALGGFILRDPFKQQYNYILNSNNLPGEKEVNRSFLLKIYLGINAGINL